MSDGIKRIPDDLDECDLCGVFNAEYSEFVEKGKTGEMKKMELCAECHEKAMDYRHGVEVDWDAEKRLAGE